MRKDIKFSRVWAMPNKETFKIKPIRELLSKYVPEGERNNWIDFFARDAKLAQYTNDINPNYLTDYCRDALDLSIYLLNKKKQFKGILFDAPFSFTQSKTLYHNKGKGHFDVRSDSMQYWSQFKTNIAQLVKPDGIVITCAWSSMGLGINRGFKLLEVLLVPHGGSRNDTIVVVEKKSGMWDEHPAEYFYVNR